MLLSKYANNIFNRNERLHYKEFINETILKSRGIYSLRLFTNGISCLESALFVFVVVSLHLVYSFAHSSQT